MSPLRLLSIRWRLPALFIVATAVGVLAGMTLPGARVLWAGGALLAAALAGWAAAGSITRPLDDLRDKIDKLASGEWGQVLKDRSADEIGQLSDALNRYVLVRDNEGLAGHDAARPSALAAPASARERELAGLKLLLETSRSLQTTFDFTDGTGKLLLAVNAHLRLEWSSVCLLDVSRENLQLMASAGLSDALSHDLAFAGPQPVRYAAKEGISGEVIERGLPAVVNKGERDPRFKPFPLPSSQQSAPKKIRTMACVPFKVGGETVGVGNFVNISSPGGFTDAEVAFLTEAMGIAAQFYLKSRGPEEAFREAVSGLHDYDYWKSLFAMECQRMRRRPSRIAMVKVQCVFGRSPMPSAEQNEALSQVGGILRETLRRQDGATRVRDAFYVYLTDTDMLGALFFSGRVKDRIDALGGRPENPELRYTAALGVAACPEHVAEPEGLPEACDAAVRESLRIGDHRLVCYQKTFDTGAGLPAKEAV